MNWLSIAKKAAPYIAAITAITGTLTYSYNMGVSHERIRQQAESVRAANAHKAVIEAAIKDALAVQAADHRDALARAQSRVKTVTVTEEVVKYVDKIVIDDSCHKLALDFISVRRQSTDSIRAAGGAESAD